ncbi:MAG: AAA family ATPase [Promethearchaeia archaeon]
MKVIGFTGLPGSGKSTAIEAIEHLGKVVTMGNVIRNETKKRGLEPTDKNLGEIARDLREKGGSKIIAQKCVDLIEKLDAQVIFIDGIRSYDEVKVFKNYWDFPYIAVTADEELRFARLKARGRDDDPQTQNDLKKRDAREIQFGLKKAIKKATYEVKNNSTEQELKEKVKEIIKTIINN